jgi:predicted ATP-grasp superfamily ATP-dependent carboligase
LKPVEGGVALHLNRDYLQEFLEGEPRSAVYIGDGTKALLLGMTRQLTGESWLHAGPFRYCGSVGPLQISTGEREGLTKLGTVLAAGCGLKGLFGVDGIWRDAALWPVEINPRYTASVEVIEYACAIPALQWHSEAFNSKILNAPVAANSRDFAGKAVLFAPSAFRFPAEGPWAEALSSTKAVNELPAFADVPVANSLIERGQPICTVFARAKDPVACIAALRAKADSLYSRIYEA